MDPRIRRNPRWLARFLERMGLLAAVLLAGGFLSVALVRVAPGFGTDERTFDPRLSNESIEAIRQSRTEGANVASYYWSYLRRLARGDLGTSVSLGRPVRQLLAERIGVSLRSAGAGLALAWGVALLGAFLLEWLGRRGMDSLASVAAGALLCAPAAVVALGCMYLGGKPALAIAAVLTPRLFRYLRSMVRAACGADHVLAAHAMGVSRLRILGWQIAAPLAPELLALAGVSVSMAAGAAIPVEVLCDSPGVGQLAWQAALARDLPVIVSVTLLIVAFTAVANCAAEASRAAREARI